MLGDKQASPLFKGREHMRRGYKGVLAVSSSHLLTKAFLKTHKASKFTRGVFTDKLYCKTKRLKIDYCLLNKKHTIFKVHSGLGIAVSLWENEMIPSLSGKQKNITPNRHMLNPTLSQFFPSKSIFCCYSSN